jgi:glycosyltransferase involved in cell wall biosynthesis
MIVGVDGNEANSITRVGVGWYAYHLLQELSIRATKEKQIRVFLKTSPLEDLPEETAYFKYVVVPKRTVWSQIDLPLALSLSHRDLNVFLSPAHYAPRFCPCPTVVVVHDLSYFYYPQDFLKRDLYQLFSWTKYSIKRASKIIAVSEVTKNDLITNYQILADKIKVVYNGFEVSSAKSKPPETPPSTPYFLYLGTLQPRKNIANLLRAFARFLKRYPRYSLYLVGQKGWLYEEVLNLVQKLRLTEAVVFTGYVSEGAKKYFLNNAKALLMPGFYEGFGQPVLEAFAAKVPVLSSSTGALPEIAGEAALYFNPASVGEITNCMMLIAENNELVTGLEKKALSRLKNFSWAETADKILETLGEVVA